jgi:excisionase family DNA binding protein
MTLVNAETISKQFSIPKGTIYYYIAKNTIPYYRVRGRVKFSVAERVPALLISGWRSRSLKEGS